MAKKTGQKPRSFLGFILSNLAANSGVVDSKCCDPWALKAPALRLLPRNCHISCVLSRTFARFGLRKARCFEVLSTSLDSPTLKLLDSENQPFFLGNFGSARCCRLAERRFPSYIRGRSCRIFCNSYRTESQTGFQTSRGWPALIF